MHAAIRRVPWGSAGHRRAGVVTGLHEVELGGGVFAPVGAPEEDFIHGGTG